MKNNVVLDKSEAFALRVVNLYKYLTETAPKREFVMSKQLLRCGTSIGANINEAEKGISKDDFQAKMYIAFKEAAESGYWLRLLYRAQYITKEMFDSMTTDCEELDKLLSSITKTVKEKKLSK